MGISAGHQWAVSWPPMGSFSWPLTPKYNDLGWNYFTERNELSRRHTVANGGSKAKLCRSTFFSNALLDSHNESDWSLLAKTVELPESATRNPLRYTFKVQQLAEQISFTIPQLIEAMQVVNDSGLWTVFSDVLDDDPFGGMLESNHYADAGITMVPNHKLHALVWEIENHNSGKQLTVWEVANGFSGQDSSSQRYADLPPLGYHFIYALRSHTSGDVLAIGQTTQTLVNRLHQHEQQGTNDRANARILEVLKNPDDNLEIIQLTTVWHEQVSAVEMMMANAYLKTGSPIENKVLTVARNNGTIKTDSRLLGMPGDKRSIELAMSWAANHGQFILEPR